MGYTYLNLWDGGTSVVQTTDIPLSELDRISRQVLLDHKRDLEDNSVVEFAEVETCELLDLVKSVNEGVSVYEELLCKLSAVLSERPAVSASH